MEKQSAPWGAKPIVLLILLVGIAGIGVMKLEIDFLIKEKVVLKSDLLLRNSEVSSLKQEVQDLTTARDTLSMELSNQKAIVDSLGGQVKNITNDVGNLVKLSKTDPELLKKYSKIYFLNENYRPEKLLRIDTQYTQDDREEYFATDIWPYLKNLLDAARSQSISLKIISGFRSFGTQSDLKASYKTIFGTTSANQFSADQGYSEHQLGTAVDFTNSSLGADFSNFGKSRDYTWLTSHAYEFGFILSYPSGNKYYVFEPWHWRFVGKNLAKKLHDENKNFYDLDQREIDAYLSSFFD